MQPIRCRQHLEMAGPDADTICKEANTYGYDNDGRYAVNKAYSIDGKFLHRIGEKERE